MENVKENFLKKYFRNLKSDKKTQIITIIILALLVLIIVAIFYFTSDKKLVFEDLLKQEKEQEKQQEAQNGRRIDGMIVDEGQENIYPVAVMVENLTTVRPQSGLSQAGVVYEALAEGGITRFMAVFAGGEASKIGPVRSARSYYLEWQSEYDAMYVFSGAYPPVLQAVSGLGIKDLNAMYAGSKYFWRDSSVGAPHNLFTSSEKINLALRDYEYDQITSEYRQWKFVDEAVEADRTSEEKSISIDFSSVGYKVVYKYDRETNSYLRFNPEGAMHSDRNTGEQLSPKNVVIIRVPAEVIDNDGRLGMDVTGEGEAIMFSNGKTYKGKWSKASRTDRTIFYHEDGTEHEFVRGQTWIEVVPPDRNVTYSE